jgi:hypothetical protein
MKKENLTKNEEVLNIDEELMNLTTVSSKIRYLHNLGWKRSAIAKKLNKRYQHIRNVLLTPLKSNLS